MIYIFFKLNLVVCAWIICNSVLWWTHKRNFMMVQYSTAHNGGRGVHCTVLFVRMCSGVTVIFFFEGRTFLFFFICCKQRRMYNKVAVRYRTVTLWALKSWSWASSARSVVMDDDTATTARRQRRWCMITVNCMRCSFSHLCCCCYCCFLYSKYLNL